MLTNQFYGSEGVEGCGSEGWRNYIHKRMGREGLTFTVFLESIILSVFAFLSQEDFCLKTSP